MITFGEVMHSRERYNLLELFNGNFQALDHRIVQFIRGLLATFATMTVVQSIRLSPKRKIVACRYVR